jgi:pantoate--beta-alanine ligase
MQVVRTVSDWRNIRRSLSPSVSVGFVPTMGALHAGHVSLLNRAREGFLA